MRTKKTVAFTVLKYTQTQRHMHAHAHIVIIAQTLTNHLNTHLSGGTHRYVLLGVEYAKICTIHANQLRKIHIHRISTRIAQPKLHLHAEYTVFS